MREQRKSRKSATLPNDPAAEAAVLASMIVDPDCIPFVLKTVAVEMFFVPEHRLIFRAIRALHERNGEKIDGLLVREELERSKQLEQIGGAEYLVEILQTVPSSGSVQYYAEIVVDRSLRRQAILAGERLIRNAMDPGVQIGEELAGARLELCEIGVCKASANGLETFCAADIAPQTPTFHLDNMLVDFGINLLQGDGGVGKSRVSHHVAAKTSTGECLAGTNLRPRKGLVRIFSVEDPKEFIVASLVANGADPKRVFIVPKVFDLRAAMGELDSWQSEHCDCRLWVFDSLPSYLGDANGNSNTEVRAVLTPLAELAAKWRVCILGLNHLNKRADLGHIHRGLGSTAFAALARSVWAVVLDKDDPELRILGPVKTNYSVKPTGLRYRIIDDRIVFESAPWTGRIDEETRPREGGLKVDECARWLKERLSRGAVLSTTIWEEASGAGFNRSLCLRAKDRLGLRATKAGFNGGWFWALGGNGDGE